jgi:Spy/CpxP family protein refolding chaperone
MIRRSRVLALTAFVLVLVGGSLAIGQVLGPGGFRGRGPGMGPGGPGALGLPLAELNLTDAQREQVRQLMEQFQAQNRTLFERVRQGEEARRNAVETTPVDESRIRTVMQQLAEAETELAVQRARLHSEIHALLTPEQQAQAQKLRADREARLKQRQDRLQQRLQQRGTRPQA